MVNWPSPSRSEVAGFVLGGVLYASVWLLIFGSGSPLPFYAWILAGGIALGGLASFAFVRGRLITPLLIALFVLLLGLIPSARAPDVSSGSPGVLSLVFLFGWPVLLGLAGLLFRIERSIRN